jgi:SRSO17 transposase
MLPGTRKSVEPIAAQCDPEQPAARHQALHHFVARAPWSPDALFAAMQKTVLPSLQAQGPITAWILDDTSFPKRGRHAVGVAWQYCNVLDRKTYCQVGVSLSVATATDSLPLAFDLYLPASWAEDPVRRQRVGVPAAVTFRTKPQSALEQIDRALAAAVPPGVVLADAAYGNETALRDALTARGLSYVVAVQKSTKVWPPGQPPPPPPPRPRHQAGPARRLLRREPGHDPVTLLDLALNLPATAWHEVSWRDGVGGELRSRFARVRVRPSHRDIYRTEPRPEEDLLIEWPAAEAEPIRYWLSTVPATLPLTELVRTAKHRWWIERNYRDLKQELGFDAYQGRSWLGVHHHAALAIAAYGCLVRERSLFPPGHPRPRHPRTAARTATPVHRRPPALPPAPGTSYRFLHCHRAPASHR